MTAQAIRLGTTEMQCGVIIDYYYTCNPIKVTKATHCNFVFITNSIHLSNPSVSGFCCCELIFTALFSIQLCTSPLTHFHPENLYMNIFMI